ncbi:MAG: tetratricopeptide repeat protein [Candidatus Omnitrophica bacterium]|nr:tetratricopeptide repeat protein [Candidatus Omnitrophota bacterium]
MKQKIGLVLFGVFFCMILIEVGLRVGGFIMLSIQEHRNLVSINKNGIYKILCLGGSTTADGGEYSYPAQLQEILNSKNVGIEFKVINKGVSGADSAFVLSNLNENLNKYDPDMVITMMGINDDVDTIPYDNSFKTKLLMLFRGLRVYKLSKSIVLHINNKIHEMNNESEKENEYVVIRKRNSIEVSNLIEEWMAYSSDGKHKDAEMVIKKAIEIEPTNTDLYVMLGDGYIQQRKFVKAEQSINRALEMSPNDPWVLYELGMCYRKQKKYSKAEEVLLKATISDPMYREPYSELATMYRQQRKIKNLLTLCDRINKKGLKSDYFYGFLANCYSESGKHDEAEKFYEKANQYRLNNYKEATAFNYNKIKEIVAQKGIKHVCMQYPVRNVEPLKKIFESTEGMVFVDNEKSFKLMLRNHSYGEYFFDNFGGDFGHCMPKGNKLLAENVARVIIDKFFKM